MSRAPIIGCRRPDLSATSLEKPSPSAGHFRARRCARAAPNSAQSATEHPACMYSFADNRPNAHAAILSHVRAGGRAVPPAKSPRATRLSPHATPLSAMTYSYSDHHTQHSRSNDHDLSNGMAMEWISGERTSDQRERVSALYESRRDEYIQCRCPI
jgi:hypothetical protein